MSRGKTRNPACSTSCVQLVAWTAAALLLLSMIADEASGEVVAVLRDNISDHTNFNTVDTPGLINFFDGAGQPSLFDFSVALSFIGDGHQIATIETIFQYGDQSTGQLNSGDIQSVNWIGGIYLDRSSYTAEGATGDDPSNPPDFFIRVADPSNADYLTPVGNSGGANNYHAVLDVSEMNWTTISGQDHLAYLTPEGVIGGSVTTLSAFSNDQGSTTGVGVDLRDRVADSGSGPSDFSDLPFPSAAGRITTITAVPEPSIVVLLIIGFSVGFTWTRRDLRHRKFGHPTS